jgi:tape measure domain-containing protein
MVSQIINVIVNSKGAVTVRKELTAIGDSARQTTTYLNGLRSILAAALTFSGTHQIIETIDNFTALQNRLRQVSDASNTVSQSWSRLLQIANNSYSTIDSTVNLYFRVVQAYKAWGESADKAYHFTDLFQKAALLSGSTMQTTSQAVYQFSQALNKGKLDGDEFRSVLEGLPYVASLIQKELGVTRAQLYEMSADGKISLSRIKDAFENAAKTIQSDWRNITPTIGMALAVLQNQWVDFIGRIQTSTGVFSLVARSILLIANNFDTLAIALSPVVVSLAFLAGRLGLGLVVVGLRDMALALRAVIPAVISFNAILLANPLILIGTLIAGAVAALVYFRNEIGLTDEVLLGLWETAKETFNSIWSFVMPLISGIGEVLSYFLKWNIAFQAISAVARLTKDDISSMFKAIMAAVTSTVTYVVQAVAPLFQSLNAMAEAFTLLIIELVQVHFELLMEAINAVLPAFRTVWNFIEPAMKKFGSLLSEIFQGWQIMASWFTANFLPTIKDVFEGWIIILRKVIDFVTALIETLRTAINLMKQMAGLGGGGGGAPGAYYGAQFYAGEFAKGGQFKVGGTGAGRDNTPVAFRAQRGERVTVETRKQQRQADNQNSGSPEVNVPLNITNVIDPSMMLKAMQTNAGGRTFVNVIKDNRDEIASILGVV